MPATLPQLMAMPFVVINMGGEMLYILEQRLKAQSIANDKSGKVLQDVTSALFAGPLVAELFRPQRMYSQAATHEIFSKLAHSSIMRLNESSMSKLFDLMTMGFKYQTMCCTQPADMLQVTLNHMDTMRTMVTSFPSCMALLDAAYRQVLQVYGNFTNGDWAKLRATVLGFLQDRRVKVSLFLQDGLQTADGMIVISHKGPLPQGGAKPGLIRYFDNGQFKNSTTIPTANAQLTSAPPANFDIKSTSRPCQLGINLYSSERKRTGMTAAAKPKVMEPAAEVFKPSQAQQKAAKAELGLLASLVGVGEGKGKTTLNLFPEPDVPSGDSKHPGSDIIVFDAQDRKATESLWRAFGNLDFGDEGGDDEEEDDLLALMDGV